MDRTVAVVCSSGYRSSVAASVLARRGHTRVVNVLGGMMAVCASAAALAFLDWARIWWFPPIAAGSYAFAPLGYVAAKRRRRGWLLAVGLGAAHGDRHPDHHLGQLSGAPRDTAQAAAGAVWLTGAGERLWRKAHDLGEIDIRGRSC